MELFLVVVFAASAAVCAMISRADVDECSMLEDRVTQLCHGLCRNVQGSYICSCPFGYRLAPDGRTCQGWRFHLIPLLRFYFPLKNKPKTKLSFYITVFEVALLVVRQCDWLIGNWCMMTWDAMFRYRWMCGERAGAMRWRRRRLHQHKRQSFLSDDHVSYWLR